MASPVISQHVYDDRLMMIMVNFFPLLSAIKPPKLKPKKHPRENNVAATIIINDVLYVKSDSPDI